MTSVAEGEFEEETGTKGEGGSIGEGDGEETYTGDGLCWVGEEVELAGVKEEAELGLGNALGLETEGLKEGELPVEGEYNGEGARSEGEITGVGDGNFGEGCGTGVGNGT